MKKISDYFKESILDFIIEPMRTLVFYVRFLIGLIICIIPLIFDLSILTYVFFALIGVVNMILAVKSEVEAPTLIEELDLKEFKKQRNGKL